MIKIAATTMGVLGIALMGAVSQGSTGQTLTSNDASYVPAYGESLQVLTKAQYEVHAGILFDQVDMNNDAHIDVEEYSAYKVVHAELAHLNGFIAVYMGQDALPIQLPAKNKRYELSYSQEVTRIDAVAREQFYQRAGDDNTLSLSEFVEHAGDDFNQADKNRNGQLKGWELDRFVMQQVTQSNLSS